MRLCEYRYTGALIALALVWIWAPSSAALPAGSPQAVFTALTQDFEARYPFLPEQRAQWEQSKRALAARAASVQEEEELWQVLRELLGPLNDRHVSLQAPQLGTYRPGGPVAPAAPLPAGLGGAGTIGDAVSYGIRPDGVLYLRISHFRGTIADAAWVGMLDGVLQQHRKAPGVVIDVRDNHGGNYLVAREVAEAFAHRRSLFLIIEEQQKKGQRLREYLRPRAVFPSGTPITVLTNRNTASAAEVFVLAMRTLPNVTHAGERTAGASGHTDTRRLPNGWQYTLPTNLFLTKSGEPFAIRGIAPQQ
jgi:hypothetical protein